ncbi:Asp23/Gls24 family envelope stress response protein [Aerococcus sanguinicola]|uniref:Asp23/Gls24 family envelope stress response protein n=1 Tax=unclassified Aerococcus TaxID=2618060 RepID=UPI0008A3A023|nr:MULTISPECIES: Asp23/Gls24 family envelope stress response protein [unclassified Aerococcus]KAB0646606.1 Asp23/Gls24 family envelope stress response protein [Aerococcus sanguinicola]MDK6233977.1 Asp23/Gls24 family envelope stress response protein [Aerococcus sp. UMB10185]MDK6856679.1 Asp23/Gls24 family envelope stress response protein [Aerococcus sp. UMB7533]MDK8502723.1 Asp23/Gls24 family envelope stress response protein [Aerococcus sp. UMB1112A]OFN03992.1 alkaline-shock protein [Aerococcus
MSEQVQHENELTYEDKVIQKIANYAVQNIDGILELKGGMTSGIKGFFSDNGEDETRGVSAEVGKKEVALDLEVVGEFGKDLQKAFKDTIKVVSENVEHMTGLKVVEVNMHVNEVYTKSDYEKNKSDKEREQEARRRKEASDYSGSSRVQ